jgi:hypothetical protein
MTFWQYAHLVISSVGLVRCDLVVVLLVGHGLAHSGMLKLALGFDYLVGCCQRPPHCNGGGVAVRYSLDYTPSVDLLGHLLCPAFMSLTLDGCLVVATIQCFLLSMSWC